MQLRELAAAIAADDRAAAVACITHWRADNAPLCEYVRRKRGPLGQAYDRLVRIVASPALRDVAALASRAKPAQFVALVDQFIATCDA